MPGAWNRSHSRNFDHGTSILISKVEYQRLRDCEEHIRLIAGRRDSEVEECQRLIKKLDSDIVDAEMDEWWRGGPR